MTLIASIELPWPDKRLSPNARTHWAAKAKATKAARNEAAWRTIQAKPSKPEPSAALAIECTFFPPDKRRRDVDGMLSSSKAYFDGIADILGVDDSLWTISMRKADPVKGGKVLVEVSV